MKKLIVRYADEITGIVATAVATLVLFILSAHNEEIATGEALGFAIVIAIIMTITIALGKSISK